MLFDLYGTLAVVRTDEFDLARWRRFIALVRYAGADTDVSALELRSQYRNLCRREGRSEHRAKILDRVFEDMAQEFSRPLPASTLANCFREATTVALTVREFARPVLAAVRGAGTKIGLVSNTEAILTRFDLRRLGLSSLFDSVVLSSDVGVEKPASGIFQHALDELGMSDRRRACMVGDTYETDIIGAMSTGMSAILLDPCVARGKMGTISANAITVRPDEASVLLALRAMGAI